MTCSDLFGVYDGHIILIDCVSGKEIYNSMKDPDCPPDIYPYDIAQLEPHDGFIKIYTIAGEA